MPQKVTTAVFPVAGLGTRFLPATKSIPKEILSLVDRPLIQYAIDEARESGIEEFIFVTSRGKGALEDYFDGSPQLENALLKKGKLDLLQQVKDVSMSSGEIVYVRQRDPKGLGHAVACAAKLIGDRSFAVILPDDVISSQKPCLKQMIEAHERTGGNMMAVMEVPQDRVSDYGLVDVKEDMKDLVSVKGLVEKPKASEAPSNLAVIGRYILSPQVLRNLEDTSAGVGGEIQLTDAIAMEAKENKNVYGYRFDGQRFDCGSKSGFLEATVAFGLERQELSAGFYDFLLRTVETRRAAQ